MRKEHNLALANRPSHRQGGHVLSCRVGQQYRVVFGTVPGRPNNCSRICEGKMPPSQTATPSERQVVTQWAGLPSSIIWLAKGGLKDTTDFSQRI
jgi:hypothetical protein